MIQSQESSDRIFKFIHLSTWSPSKDRLIYPRLSFGSWVDSFSAGMFSIWSDINPNLIVITIQSQHQPIKIMCKLFMDCLWIDLSSPISLVTLGTWACFWQLPSVRGLVTGFSSQLLWWSMTNVLECHRLGRFSSTQEVAFLPLHRWMP